MSVQLAFKKAVFSLKLEQPCKIPRNACFVLRSVLGKELRSMCCVMRQNNCSTCMMKYTCIYSWIFESPVNRAAVKSRPDMASHPFIPEITGDYSDSKEYSSLTYSITLVGKGISYLPYIYYALRKAGEHGLFRERIRFTVQDIACEGQSILLSEDTIDADFGDRVFTVESEMEVESFSQYSVSVDFTTPFRFKKQGSYESDIHAGDVLLACFRRFHSLVNLYSDQSPPEEELTSLFKLDDLKSRIVREKSNLSWKEQVYFSSRQKRAMKLGGVQGVLHFTAELSPFELKMLEAGSLFHIGKNSSFGLGKIEVSYKKND